MFKKVFALGLVATASAAGAPASNNLRLRGGFAGSFAKLTEAPGECRGPRCHRPPAPHKPHNGLRVLRQA
jgi:hypothetical protein